LGHRGLHPRVASKSTKYSRRFGEPSALTFTDTRNRRTPMIQSFNPPNMSDTQKRALILGIVFLVVLLAGVFFNPRQFFQAYLIGWTFWTGIAVGSLALLMLQHLTGGGWGLVIRRSLEAATRTLPLMAVLFIPVVIGAHSIYHEWTDHEELAKHPVVQFKTPYLNLPFFTVRAAIYFAIWIALAFVLNKWWIALGTIVTRRTCDC
jgi:pheromone shutdown protein TraB